jgi:uncharacterized protein YgiM (DUF1202 family)
MRKITLLLLASSIIGIALLTGLLPTNADDAATTVTCGTQLVNQEITSDHPENTYIIALNAGDAISISMDMLASDTEINVQLFDPAQKSFIQSKTSSLVSKVNVSGDYTFVVSETTNFSAYTLSIDCVLQDGTEIKANNNHPTEPSATATPQSVTLHVFASRDSLTLFVTQTVSLNGLQFGTIINNQVILNTLTNRFDSLLLVGGIANANDCYVYVVEGAAPPLSQSCKGQVFRNIIAAADVFWYDSVTNSPRNLGIFHDGQTTGIICSAATPDCLITWTVIIPPTPTLPPSTATSSPTEVIPTAIIPTPSVPTPAITATSVQTSSTQPFVVAKLYSNVRSGPGTDFPTIAKLDAGGNVPVLARSVDGTWLKIQTNSGVGWIAARVVDLYGEMSQIPVEQSPNSVSPTATIASPTQAVGAGPHIVARQVLTNVRLGPGTSFEVIAELNQGDSAPVIARNVDGAWLKIQISSGTGWIATYLVEVSGDISTIPIEG